MSKNEMHLRNAVENYVMITTDKDGPKRRALAWEAVVQAAESVGDRMPIELSDPIRRLICHSFRDVGFEYDGLTPNEKELITREEHAALMAWVIEDISALDIRMVGDLATAIRVRKEQEK